MLTIIDEYARECLAIEVARRLTSEDVLDRLTQLFTQRRTPAHIRPDTGSEFMAQKVREWLRQLNVKTLYIEPGSPWENGYIESLDDKLRDELLDGEIFYTLKEAQVLIERWRRHYSTVRPHSSLGYRPPAPAPGSRHGPTRPSAQSCVSRGQSTALELVALLGDRSLSGPQRLVSGPYGSFGYRTPLH